ncbi:DUF1398 family protein [Paenibacillus assamensis]|uniref:DUF1398 family protein n=1 Tax=Paenibacillus assamensis TaxID=311244 RepID=UPI00041910CE|nr:DUF1398 family protein [Paenibacillus assamensis]
MRFNQESILNVATSEEHAGDFPKIVHGFKQLGIEQYDFIVDRGVYVFTDGNIRIETQLNGIPKKVNEISSKEGIKSAIKKAQGGQIDFETFITLAGEAGIAYWTADLIKMEVSYMDRSNHIIVVEPIPEYKG